MKVGIDVTSLVYNRGVSRYTANLVRALAQQPEISLRLYGSSLRQREELTQQAQALVKGSSRHRVTIQSLPPRAQEVLWNTLRLNAVKKVFPDLEVFHSWDWLQPPDQSLPLVSTIHDLAILKFPETAHPRIVKQHTAAWQRLKEQKAEIIAVSRATKRDIVELLDFPEAKVHVVYEALPTELTSVGENVTEERYELIKQKLQLNRPYVLFVGTREPRKNLMRLIEAWQPLADQVDLLIAGASGWDETSSKQAKLLKTPHLRFLGRVSDQELMVLYSEAEVFAYPCLYEGFGLPILEAFHYGVPVVTSQVSSMVEIAGNAAELVDPLEVKSIRQGITTILGENLAQEKQRLQRMIIRLHLFDWRRVAEQTIDVYHRAITNYAQD